jgi:type II secretory pathway component GspD/PulD (secretin)
MKWMFSLISLLVIQQTIAQQYADGYYTDDIGKAVNEARERPHHYDYSGTYRYKRTTAQSIDIERLDYEELDNTSIEGAVAASAAGQADPEDDAAVLKQHSELRNNTDEERLRTGNNRVAETPSNQFGHFVQSTGNAVTPSGIMSSSGIYSESNLTSTPRP